MRILLLVVLLPVLCAGQVQDFSLDDYLMRWSVAGVGNTELRIMRNEESSYINIYRSNGIVSSACRLPADDAVLVGEVLARTQEFFDAQQGSQDNVAETIDTGDFTVTFRTSVSAGFTVVIQGTDRTVTNAVTLNREEALGIQPALLKSREYVEFLNSKLGF